MFADFAIWGNSLALGIPRVLAKEISAGAGKRVDIKVGRGSLVVTPVEVIPVYCLDDMIAAMTPENTDVGEIDTGDAFGNEF